MSETGMTTRLLKGTTKPLAEAYQLALLDLDGVVYRGKNPVEYAADSIRAAERAGMTIEYTTNNSSRFQRVVAEQLRGFDLDVEPWQVITSSVVAARMVAKAVPPAPPCWSSAPSTCARRSPAPDSSSPTIPRRIPSP